MSAALVVGCALLGLVVGALLPIAIERVPERRSVLSAPYPEVAASFRTKAGWWLVGLTVALFVGLGLRFGEDWVLPAYLVFTASLVALSAIDLRLHLLPNRIVYPMAAVSVALFGLAALIEPDGDAFLRGIVCAIGAFVAFFVLHLISPRGMGFGDVKLSFVLGLALGWLGVGETVLGLFLGFVYGAVIGLVLIAIGRRSRDQHIPFGPFLAAGTMTAIYFGAEILDWYPV